MNSWQKMIMSGEIGRIYDSFDPNTLNAQAALTNNNKTVTKTTNSPEVQYNASVAGSIPLAGKIYIELYYAKGLSPAIASLIGISNGTTDLTTGPLTGNFAQSGLKGYAVYSFDYVLYHNAAAVDDYGTSFANKTHGFAIDWPNKLMWIRDSTGYLTAGDPVAGTGGVDISGSAAVSYITAGAQQQNDSITYNPGDSAFLYAVPSGFQSGHYTE